MNAAFLRPLIGNQKTLIITCQECAVDFEEEAAHRRVYLYSAPGNMLNKHDFMQQEIIRYYVETKACTQILLAGHRHCKVAHYLQDEMAADTPANALKFNLRPLLRHHHHKAIAPATRSRMLVELNLIQQGHVLMSYPFVQHLVEDHALQIIGLMTSDDDHDVRRIFHNGITFNHLIAMN